MGEEHQGGNSAMVQDQLKNIQQIHTTERVFAAILADGVFVSYLNCWMHTTMTCPWTSRSNLHHSDSFLLSVF